MCLKMVQGASQSLRSQWRRATQVEVQQTPCESENLHVLLASTHGTKPLGLRDTVLIVSEYMLNN